MGRVCGTAHNLLWVNMNAINFSLYRRHSMSVRFNGLMSIWEMSWIKHAALLNDPRCIIANIIYGYVECCNAIIVTENASIMLCVHINICG